MTTVKDAAIKLHVKPRTVVKWLQEGKLKGAQVRGRQWRVDPESIEDSLHEGGPILPAADGAQRQLVNSKIHQLRHSIGQLSEALNDISHTGSVLTGAEENGIANIYSPRRTGKDAENAMERSIVEADSEIRIMGVSLQDVFRDGSLYTALWSRIQSNHPLKIKIFLLYPLGRAANARVHVEERGMRPLTHSVLFQDIRRSIIQARALRDKIEGEKRGHELAVRFYDCVPFAHVLITEKTMIFEPYHFGTDPDKPVGCIGGFAPVFNFRSGSVFYQRMQRSFDHLWDHVNKYVDVYELDRDRVEEKMGKAISESQRSGGGNAR
jgi:excisionase family DNA binding protein